MDPDEPLPIAAVSEYGYCPRRCALIHVESIFDENVFTLRGEAAHQRADEIAWHTEEGVRIERALPVWSERLGLTGRCDIVEFRPDGTIHPVEYKYGPLPPAHGITYAQRAADLQLCAQAACLEEMFGIRVSLGSIYHISSRRRREVVIDELLRRDLEIALANIRQLFQDGINPAPANDKRCPNCALNDACVPAVLAEARFARHARDLYSLDDGLESG